MTLADLITRELRLPPPLLERLARTASHQYKTYDIPKKGGGSRTIHHPSKALKAVQRWLLDRVVSALRVHQAAYAYRAGSGYGIRANAERHASRAFLLRMDFETFFPSIKVDDLRPLIDEGAQRHFRWWTSTDTELFVRLVCRNGELTIGAPTSPALSNAVMWEFDHRITSHLVSSGVTYTRYADDLFFSSDTPNVLRTVQEDVLKIVANISMPKNISINSSKTRHLSRKWQRSVTGLVLTSEGGVSIGRPLKRHISVLVHQVDKLDEKARKHLAGMLAYCADVEPDFVNRLVVRYGPKAEQARKGH